MTLALEVSAEVMEPFCAVITTLPPAAGVPALTSPRATPPLTSVTSTLPLCEEALSTSASTVSAPSSEPIEAPSSFTLRFRVPARVELLAPVVMVLPAVRVAVVAAAVPTPLITLFWTMSPASMVRSVASMMPLLLTTELIRPLAELPCISTVWAVTVPLFLTPVRSLPVAAARVSALTLKLIRLLPCRLTVKRSPAAMVTRPTLAMTKPELSTFGATR